MLLREKNLIFICLQGQGRNRDGKISGRIRIIFDQIRRISYDIKCSKSIASRSCVPDCAGVVGKSENCQSCLSSALQQQLLHKHSHHTLKQETSLTEIHYHQTNKTFFWVGTGMGRGAW